MRLGVFGGTFDPVHNGHLALAEAALAAFALDRVLLVPGHVTPFKLGRDTAPDADRLAMLRLAIAGRPRLEVSTVELDRGGVSYTVDTLEALRAAHPADELWLLLGLDSLLTLGLWRRAHDILRLATVGTLLRPGSTLPDGDLTGFSAEESAALRAHVADGACPDISSTAIRQSLREHGTAEGLPPAVLDHIRSRRLYGIRP
jgi:nicotinate-nucleotide adenylyltransferase